MTAQDKFNLQYISTSEIMKKLGVTRTTIFNARKTGKLPNAIRIQGQCFIWERDALTPYLNAWQMVLEARRT